MPPVPYLDAPYTLFVDSDDTISPYLLSVTKSETENFQADAVYFKYIVTASNGSYIGGGGGAGDSNILEAEFSGERQHFFSEPLPWCKLLRTSLLKENDIRFPEIAAHEDVCHNIKAVASAKKVVQLPIPLYFYRTGRQAAS